MAKGSSNYTLLGEGTVLQGSLYVPHSLHIDGTFKGGKLDTTEDLKVGENGVVEGEVSARNTIIAGKITGNVTVEERAELLASASLNGDLRARELIIEEGAFFQGNCQMTSGKNVKI